MNKLLNLYPVNLSTTNGKLLIVSRPLGYESLEESIEFFKSQSIMNIVSALEREEEIELGLLNEKEVCEKNGICFFSFPIRDRSVPESIYSLNNLVIHLKEKILNGESIGVHCRASIGRASIISACILKTFGYNLDSSLSLLSKSRNLKIPDTEEQENWIRNYFSLKEKNFLRL